MPVRTPLPDKRAEARFWFENADRLDNQPVPNYHFAVASRRHAARFRMMTNAQYKIERDKILRLNNG